MEKIKWIGKWIFGIGCYLIPGFLFAQTHTGLEDKLILTEPRNFLLCNDAGTAFKTKVFNESAVGYFRDGTYELDLGDGKTVYKEMSLSDFPKTITYEENKNYTLKFSATATTGEKVTVTYEVRTLSRPKINLQKQDENVKCLDNDVIYLVDVYDQNTEGTKYTLDYDDGSEPDRMTNDELRKAGGKFVHRYEHSYCDRMHPGSSSEAFVVTLKVLNECEEYEEETTVKEYVVEPFDAKFTFQEFSAEKACTYENVRLRNITTGGKGSNCKYGEVFWEWDFGNGKTSEQKEPSITYTEAKKYTIRLIASNIYACATDTAYQDVVLINRVGAKFNISKDTLCVGESALRFTNESTGDEMQPFFWDIQVLTGGPAPVISDRTQTHQDFLFEHWGTYRVSLLVSNECSSDRKDTIITVKEDPHIARFDFPANSCPAILDMRAYAQVEWNGNAEKPEWTITRDGSAPNADVIYTEGNKNTTYPKVNFQKAGDYTITLTLKTAGCGGTTLTKTARIHIYESNIQLNIAPNPAVKEGWITVCDGKSIVFENTSTGEDLETEVIVEPIYSASEPGNYTYKVENGTLPLSRKVSFNGYGDCQVSIYVKGHCQTKAQSYKVHVIKDPSVDYLYLPEAICPREILEMREYVGYSWNGNVKKAHWSIIPATYEYVNGTGADDPYPQIHFKESVEYQITVTLDPSICPDPSIVKTRTGKVRVRQSALEATVSATKDSICETDMVVFNNTASDPEGKLEYTWTIEPVTGWREPDLTNEVPNYRVFFDEWGTYYITGEVRSYCDTLTANPLKVIVHKNAEVTLRETVMCPGVVKLKDFVEYQWYNNRQQVNWKITRMDGMDTPSDYEWVSGNATSFYPEIRLKKAGDYQVQVSLGEVVCEEGKDKLSATKIYHVYDTTISGNITYAVTPELPDPKDICEGQTLTFENTTAEEGGLQYYWSVEGNIDGYGFADGSKTSELPIPSITFTKYGQYTVKVRAVGKCNAREWSLPVTVRGVPEVILKDRLSRVCMGGEVEMNLYLSYPDAGNGNKNNPLTYEWKVEADRNITHAAVIAQPTADFTKIGFPENAHYTITLSVGSKCVLDGKRTYTTEIDVVSSQMQAAFSVGTDSVGCVNDPDPFEIRLQNRSVGDSLTYEWSVSPREGIALTEGDWQTESPKVVVSKEGFYELKLHIDNGCATDDSVFRVKAFAVPEVRIADIRDECEPFRFSGKDRITVNEHNDAVRDITWKIVSNPGYTSEGYDFTDATTSKSYYPEIDFNTCDYTVTAEYRNRCKTPGKAEFLVKVDKFIPIDLALEEKQVCVKTEPFALEANPVGGVWTFKVNDLEHPEKILYRDAGGKYYFNPEFDAYFEKDIELVYSKANLTCMARDTMTIYVNPLPHVEAGDPLEMCVNHLPKPLLNGAPTGGIWKSGDTELTDGSFHPVRDGDFMLKYFYSDANGCRNIDSTVLTVHPLPVTAFNTGGERHCINTEVSFTPEDITSGNTYEWEFGDEATKETSTGVQGHIYTVAAFRKVSNITTSVHGCQDFSDTATIEILNLPPPAFFKTDTLDGCDTVKVNITIDPDAYADNHNHLYFKWEYGEGTVTEDLMPISPKSYYPGDWDTTYVTRFTVSNMCDTTSWEKTVTVFSSPKVSFALNHPYECSPVYLELQNTTTGNNCVWHWTFTNGRTGEVIERTGQRNPKYEFTTDTASTTFYIGLRALNKCDEDEFIDSLVVKPRSVFAHFTPSRFNACVGENICFRNNSTDTFASIVSTAWDFGDGGAVSEWTPCHVYGTEGKYEVSLRVDNGCGYHTFYDTIRVNPVPKLEIISEDHLCEADTFTFVLHSDQKLDSVGWDLGNGVLDNRDSFRYCYEGYGKYTIRVGGKSIERGQCRALQTKEIEVYNKPIVTISPLDTAACSPLEYVPVITGEGFFMWDFGDGSDLISSEEHLYTNESDSVEKHRLTVYVETDKGCKSDYRGWITVYNLPRAKLDKKVEKGRPEKVTFINLSEEYTDCLWTLPFGENFHSLGNQTVEFQENGMYTVKLVARNYLGCLDSTELVHEVEMKGLFFPNTFIPHSKNGKVNRFNGIGMGLREYRLEIYDKYGNKVWETTALEDGKPSEGWDGCNTKGQRLPQDVYLWRAQAIFINDDIWTGKNNDSGVRETVQGTVMLLRE